METSKETGNLEILNRSRTPRRIIFTKKVNEILEESKAVPPNEFLLIGKRNFIVQNYQQLKEYDEKMKLKWSMQRRMKSKRSKEKDKAMLEAGSGISRKAKLKLPKMELPYFDGGLENWIPWLSRFKKVHEDRGLNNDDKIHYLVEAIITGSRAHRLLGSYIPTGEYY
ncbi:hypothetical protein LAZ67_10001910 [Cordylochernes scorpioides]|uniref:Uncharacterized protein n=1 Tax=Cordylochernes scorpioides TaxID=51811 RepID=A0ABY6KW90_9ARAC|nr:hypothetical protein LAZ67_10001910 [Cordylochernes scorpioides]